jgi:DNA-directed RNA polymerase subunit RPC12/RpoP
LPAGDIFKGENMCENETNNEFTDKIVCPKCGYKFIDSSLYEDKEEIKCDCGSSFIVTINIDINYTTTLKY